ncbi:MAG: hypothetical protein Q8K58_13585 [Acidimicrobiales bacterium]|nr:hypothetical protein [Acidimicrobiales bacterium]
MTDGPATHDGDGNPVGWNDAVRAWTTAAVRLLEATASTYGSYLTYGQLAEAVQAETGIATRSLMQNWIGEILRAVSDADAVADQPMLSSLIVRADQTIGAGYGDAVHSRTGVLPEDLELHAAAERLACYRFYGAEVPDGAEPALPPNVASARATAARSARDAKPRPVCPSCFMQLPLTGICGTCD